MQINSKLNEKYEKDCVEEGAEKPLLKPFL